MVTPNIVARRMIPADRDAVLSNDFLKGDERAIDQPQASVHVVEEDGTIVGVALGLRPSSTDMPANWGNILLRYPDNMSHWVKLMLVKVQDAVNDGWTEGFTQAKDPRLLPIGEDYFGVEATEIGWNPSTHEAVEWEFRTDLVSFLETLKRLDGSF